MKISHTIAVLFTFFLFAASAVMPAGEAHAQDRDGGNFGIGVILGEPTGITPKVWVSNSTAFAAGVAWSFSGNNTMHMHLDYQLHNFQVIQVEQGSMSLYYGLGGRMLFRENRDDKVGLRLPLGINYLFSGAPVEAFLEVAPVLDLAPSTDFSANGGIGIRYYF